MTTSAPQNPVTGPVRGSPGPRVATPAGALAALLAERQSARATMRMGKLFKSKAEVNVSTGGILGIAVLVCGILLSTAVLVASAKRPGGG